MGKEKKWKFKGIKDNTPFIEAANAIINIRSNAVNKSILKYLKNNDVENLHEIRIAVRRLRYNMEIFSTCFDKKKFLVAYNLVEHIQDLTGQTRDLDVLLESITKISLDKEINVENRILESIKIQRDMLNNTLKLELFNYLHSKGLKDFKKLLNKNGD